MKALLMTSKSGGGGGAKSPHCKVCGDESSGFHYGVDSCEGCKGFFRRCITQGMTHKCANDEKCEITPFTRNSCQYCRLKKCFQVGMSREASRLGRRPKRLKDVSGDGARAQTTNLPIAPYPSQQELHRLKMAELQKLLQENGTFKSELMQAFLSVAQQSFREHAKTGNQQTPASSSASSSGTTSMAHVTSTSSLDATAATTIINNNKAAAQGQQQQHQHHHHHHHPSSTSPSPSSSSSLATAAVSSSGGPLQQQQHHQQVHSSGNGGLILSGGGGDSNSNNALMTSAPPSPFNELTLGLAELSPMNPADALNLGATPGHLSSGRTPPGAGGGGGHLMYDSKYLVGNLNGNNSAYSPGSNPDNMPSPLGIPGIDNVDLAASPSTFMTFNPLGPMHGGGGGGASKPTSPSTPQYGLGVSGPASGENLGRLESITPPLPPLDSKANLNLNPKLVDSKAHLHINPNLAGECSPGPSMLSPTFIKQEVDMDAFRSESDGPFYVDPNVNCLADIDRVLAEVKETPSEKRRLLIDQVTDAIVEAHMATTLNTQDNIRQANERIAREERMLPINMCDMVMQVKDPNIMWQHFLNSLVPEITKVVKFCKKLPGFSDIVVDDQIKLIKQGSFEVMMSRISLLVDHINDTMIDPSLKMKSSRAMIRQMPPLGPFLDEFFDIAKQTNPLNLTDGENGLFGAILMICPDRHGLKNVTTVQTIQQLYLQALYLLMRHNHKDADEIFCSLIATIPLIRKVNDDHFRFLNNIKMKSATEFEGSFPELHREIFDTANH